jgi:hypothetical protein
MKTSWSPSLHDIAFVLHGWHSQKHSPLNSEVNTTFLNSFCNTANGLWIYCVEVFVASREIIQPHQGDKRYARRNSQRQFGENQVNRCSRAKTTVPKGQYDRGDEKKS